MSEHNVTLYCGGVECPVLKGALEPGTYHCTEGSLWIVDNNRDLYRDIIHRNETFFLSEGYTVKPYLGDAELIKLRAPNVIPRQQFDRMMERLSFPNFKRLTADKRNWTMMHLRRLAEGQHAVTCEGGFSVKIRMVELAKFMDMRREFLSKKYIEPLEAKGMAKQVGGFNIEVYLDDAQYRKVLDVRTRSLKLPRVA